MTVFGDNVAMLRLERDMTQLELAKKLGVSRGTVAAWEVRGTLPNMGTMDKLQEVFGVSAGELFTPHITARNDEDFSSVEVGVYGSIAAGTPIDMVEADYGFPCPSQLMREHPHAFYLKVEGESMSRVLPDGCYALIDPDQSEPVVNGKAYAVCVNGYSATIKRVRQLANGVELIPDSLDPTYRPKIFDRNVEGTESITIIGKVIWKTFPFDYEI